MKLKLKRWAFIATTQDQHTQFQWFTDIFSWNFIFQVNEQFWQQSEIISFISKTEPKESEVSTKARRPEESVVYSSVTCTVGKIEADTASVSSEGVNLHFLFYNQKFSIALILPLLRLETSSKSNIAIPRKDEL